VPDETDNKSDIKSKSSNPDPKNPDPKPKSALKKVTKKPKYEELPEIPDYEKPQLETYEPSDFDPSKNIKEKAEASLKPKVQEKASLKDPKTTEKPKDDDSSAIKDYEKAELERYEKSEYENIQKGSETKMKPKLEQKAKQEPEPVFQKPTLKKTAKEVPAEEVVETKPKIKFGPKPKYEELPKIPEYDKPELENYEESDFNPSKRGSRDENAIPKKEIEEEPKKPQKKIAIKIDESILDKKSLLKPADKNKPRGKPKIEPESVSIQTPKFALKKPVEDTPDTKMSWKKPKPPTIAEECVSKDITVKGEPEWREDTPIEITITEPEEPQASDRKLSLKQEDEGTKKSVSFDKDAKENEPTEKKKIPRKKYDPLAYIPDEDVVMEEESSQSPIPQIIEPPKSTETPKPRIKYDPFKYVPDKEDGSPVDSVDDSKVNTITNMLHFLSSKLYNTN
jgi:hypothetical protein